MIWDLLIKCVYLQRRKGKEDRECPLFLYLIRMIKKEEILSIVEAKTAEDNVFVVDVKVSPANQIYVEIDAFDGVNIDYCVKLSKYIEGHFDRETEDFELEVSTSSISAPFKVLNHYIKNIGREIELFTLDNKKLIGLLKDANADGFTLEEEQLKKIEGKKKKQTVITLHKFIYDEVRMVKQIIKI